MCNIMKPKTGAWGIKTNDNKSQMQLNIYYTNMIFI